MHGSNKNEVVRGLKLMEWLIVVGTVVSVGVSITAYAFTHFEQKNDAETRESRLHEEIKEVRENLKNLNESVGVGYKKTAP